ncbi:secretion protein EspA [Salmonella enterica]|nr:secretion protein EspA [Salmonella enterica]HCL5256043.1 secretion protein EspA [Salmonella enterica]
MDNLSAVSASSAMQNIYDLGSMSREDVVKLLAKLGVFQAALLVLAYMYNAQSKLSISMYADMNESSKQSTMAQKMANLVDAKIADVQSSSDKNAKAKLPQEVIDYVSDPRNGVKVSGLSSDVNISSDMGAGDLQTVKAAISANANTLTTTVNNSQLSIQQMSNTLNLLTSARSDMQSLQYRTISAISIGK